jgi:hypothetical protein
MNNLLKKLNFKFLTLCLFVIIFQRAFAQGTTCAGATSLTVDGACGSGAISDATIDGNATVCGGTVVREAWYVFTATSASITIAVNANRDVAIELLSTCAGAAIGCDNTTVGAGIDTETLNATGLTIGTTYYVRVVNVGANNMTLNSLCITTTASGGTGCTSNTTLYPSATFTPTCDGSAENITTAGYATEYSMVYVTAGTTYTFSSSNSTDYLTIANSGGGAPVYASGTTPVIWTASITGPVRFYNNTNSACGTNTSIRTRAVMCGTPPPAYNPCTSTTNIASCGTTINATIASGTGAFGGTSSCGFTTSGKELIYTFTPTTTGNYYIQQTSSFAYIDYQFKLVSAGCSSSGWTCVDDISGAGTSSSAMALTAGTAYYILLDPESTAGGNVSFSVLCPPSPPTNDNCAGALSIPVNSGSSCTSLANGTIFGATATGYANACGGTPDDDVWYSFVAASSTHSISITNIIGSTSDMYHSVYAGSCASLGSPILCSDPNTSTISGLILGNTYFVRVYSWTSTGNQTSTFSVCVTTPPPTGVCGNPANNDYCSNPATLTQGVGTFSSTTSSTYSSDQPGNVSSIFCGSMENNSWYSFVATGTTASFPFTSVSGCTWNDGVQAQVYKVSTNASGCCTSFTSVSNCYNPGTTATGTVNATGLTVGQTYILMVDGFAGDVCNFTVSGWTAVGILPMELLTFTGHNEDEKNKIQWVTASEKDSKYFTIEKSKDGITFEKLMDIDAAGFSTSPQYYNAFDLQPFKEISYYRLKLFNVDHSFEYSNIISINNKNLTDYISDARPNPTNGSMEFDLNSNSKQKVLIEIYSNTGLLVSSEQKIIDGGYKSINLDLNQYASGIYLLKVLFETSGRSEIQKIIKN